MFGKPLARFQNRVRRNWSGAHEITAMQLYVATHRTLYDTKELADTIAALGKLNNTVKALRGSPKRAHLLGGNGSFLRTTSSGTWTTSKPSYTFEGTETIQTLLVGPRHHRVERLPWPRGSRGQPFARVQPDDHMECSNRIGVRMAPRDKIVLPRRGRRADRDGDTVSGRFRPAQCFA